MIQLFWNKLNFYLNSLYNINDYSSFNNYNNKLIYFNNYNTKKYNNLKVTFLFKKYSIVQNNNFDSRFLLINNYFDFKYYKFFNFFNLI